MQAIYDAILQILDAISFPTAFVAVVASAIINEINRIRKKRRDERQAIKDWFDEVVVLGRELQLLATTYEEYVKLAEEKAPKPDRFENLDKFGEYMDVDDRFLNPGDGSTEYGGFYDSILEKDIEEVRDETLPVLANAQEESSRYYTKLRDQWAKMPYDYKDESLPQVQNKLLKTATHCLAISNGREPNQEDYKKLLKLSGDLSEEAAKAKESVTVTRSIWNRYR